MAVAAARVSVAVLVPELAVADAVNVVVPHPVAVTSVMLPAAASPNPQMTYGLHTV